MKASLPLIGKTRHSSASLPAAPQLFVAEGPRVRRGLQGFLHREMQQGDNGHVARARRGGS